MNDPVTQIIEKLELAKRRWNEVENQLNEPAATSDMDRYIELRKEYKELQKIMEMYKKYKNVMDDMESCRQILEEEKDEELRTLAREEMDVLSTKSKSIEQEIRLLLTPKEPEDCKNAVMEIRAGTGGDEASLFAGDLYRMYTRYCESKGWINELVDFAEGTVGGFKEIIFNVKGEGAYGELKYESGVHRVQRVPETETQGRVHTSAATVAVLPEATEVEVHIREQDIRKDTFCASGHGGQSVNTTYSAVRLTHIPTGMVASCQDERSQIRNYQKALMVLRSRLYEQEIRKRTDETSAKRKTMVSTGDRSAKIRTYNFPQNRLTDHRIGLTKYNLGEIIEGNIQEIIDALKIEEHTVQKQGD